MTENRILDFGDAAIIIKDAIVRSRYQAAKLINKELLGLYYAVGRYVSNNSRIGSWGKGAIRQLSDNLQRELPGLRGFSESSIKRMREFYEQWCAVFSNRPLSMGDLAITKNGDARPEEYVRQADEAPSIGIILCKEANRSIVEFAVRDYTKPMGVATYRTRNEMPETWQKALLDFEDMKKLLDATPNE